VTLGAMQIGNRFETVSIPIPLPNHRAKATVLIKTKGFS